MLCKNPFKGVLKLVLFAFFLSFSISGYAQIPPPPSADTLRFEAAIPGYSAWPENGFLWDAYLGYGHIDGNPDNAASGNNSLQFGAPGGTLSTCGQFDLTSMKVLIPQNFNDLNYFAISGIDANGNTQYSINFSDSLYVLASGYYTVEMNWQNISHIQFEINGIVGTGDYTPYGDYFVVNVDDIAYFPHPCVPTTIDSLPPLINV